MPSGIGLVGAKPQRHDGGFTGYFYDPDAPVGQRLGITYPITIGRFVSTPHEAMAYVAQSPTKTIGAEGRANGSIGGKVDMAMYGFDNLHSAQFTFPLQRNEDFYHRLLDEFGIPRPR